jgi:hypothetical protein
MHVKETHRMSATSTCSKVLGLLLAITTVASVSSLAGQSAPAQPGAAPSAAYDKSIFQKPIPPDQLAFIAQFAGKPSGEIMKDKQFRKLLKSVMPDCMFHYGNDKPLNDAMDLVMEGSKIPVVVRDNRFALVAGVMGPILSGKGFLWFDLQEGIALGGFYFHPTNGEPTPALNVFSRQVKEQYLSLSQMPPDFVMDLVQWQTLAHVPPVTARYFLTGSNRKILLEHDEDYCLSWDGTKLPPESGCQQMAADAADLDLSAAYYVDATHHATNATAWMMNQDQISFMETRDRTCRVGPDPLGCRIHMTRERTGVLINRPVRAPHPVHH